MFVFYLTLPDKAIISNFYDQDMVTDFLHVSYLEGLEKQYDEVTNRWTYLYAWTIDKDYARSFVDTHDMKMFTCVKRKVDSGDLDVMKRAYGESVLVKYPYMDIISSRFGKNSKDIDETKLEDMHIIIPKFETTDLEFVAESWLQDTTMDRLTDTPVYDIFKHKYLKVLDLLGYTTTIERITDPEAAYDRESYGVSPLGYASQVFWKPDILSIYCKLFRLILTKDDEKGNDYDDL